ncbi:helix-turn-helix transcriptional regulator [Candidatus Bipolaricaulota bacterium]|nr:helix-turn-helix transcriptional regulator [Candidatus Bipolaricaulota bacterium]
MGTKVIKLEQAEKMMTYLEIHPETGLIMVRFADGKQGFIPTGDIVSQSSNTQLNFDKVKLPNPYEFEIECEHGEMVKVPWDFARGYCDENYQDIESKRASEGRSILGERVAKIRKTRGFSQKDLAKRAEIGRVTVSRIENGEQSPRYKTLEKLARALGVEVVSMLAGSGC